MCLHQQISRGVYYFHGIECCLCYRDGVIRLNAVLSEKPHTPTHKPTGLLLNTPQYQ